MAENEVHLAPEREYSIMDVGHNQSRDEKTAAVPTAKVLAQEPEAISTPGHSQEADAVSHRSKIEKAASTSDDENAQLDPRSRDFSYEKWVTSRFRDLTKCHRRASGVAYRNLNVYGFGVSTDYQKTFANYPLVYLSRFGTLFGRQRKSRIDILQDFEGIVNSGEILLVLGKPGSGCTTFLKALAGQTHGFFIDQKSKINYQGISHDVMHQEFRGACAYQAESDLHFPHLTTAQTLSVAAEARAPADTAPEWSRKKYAEDVRDATIAALGLSHAVDTKVGNDIVRGISGGERKRTSIAEVLIAGSSLQCWDNSTRGLDSANALEFVKTLRLFTRTTRSVALVTLYQASQDIYNAFDNVMLLYEGRQIFFGSTARAKTYFSDLGFVCPERAATSDFLTSLTNPAERIIRDGFEFKVPRTADDFARVWRDSPERAELLERITLYETQFPMDREHLENLRVTQTSYKGPNKRRHSPYIISFADQISICITRGFQRLANDLPPPISSIAGNAIVSIILGSMFYNMPADTSSFFGRGVLLFFTVLTNTFLGAFEGVQLWEHRPIVEKHFQYAFYRRSAEAIASMICDLPNKFALTTFFNIPVYFLANMRRTPGAFFTFYVFSFVSLLTGSMLFRTIGAMSRTLTASMAPGAVFILLLIIYTGFVLPVPSMPPWFRWFGYVNPIGYAFESLMINEFSGRQFPCSTFVPQGPGYLNVDAPERMCAVVGADPGSNMVNGDAYLATSFQYYPVHLWRNLAIIFALMLFLCGLYLYATEYVVALRSKGEVLIFRRGHEPGLKFTKDEESSTPHQIPIPRAHTRENGVQTSRESKGTDMHAATFLWDGLCYKVKVKGGYRNILDDVEGWIKPGTLTALMGASGAGKTTLLNVLANRASTGLIGGEKLVDVKFQNESFARKVGYAQQQDVHLATMTVREALTFSARLRQPERYTDAEKLSYVDEVINTLDMNKFADAVIGIPGEGLNVEQRKRVTIGVELVAKPELLLFLDEPTSGLDSNTAWAICTLLRKLADNGQAVLCTIHQPSGKLFEMFDKLSFLANGRSIYFGDIGLNSRSLTSYFENHGARKCSSGENSAEWLLDITGSAPGSGNRIDWAEVWHLSEERQGVKSELQRMKKTLLKPVAEAEEVSSREFASSFGYQLYTVTKRNLESNWRTPSYLYSKLFLTLGSGLVNGFSFYHSENSLQGVQNQVFSAFLLFTLHSNLVQLVMPQFLDNRAIYELSERPSRTYSWNVFVLANVIGEVPWQTLLAALSFTSWYYPLGMYRNALMTNQLHERGGLVFLIIWSFMLFSSTFSQMLATVMPDAATGINISSLLYSLSLLFSGVLVSPAALPRFWLFMYRATPVTYFINAIVSTGVAGGDIVCAASEIIKFAPPSGQTCSLYLKEYMSYAGGTLLNPRATKQCDFCRVAGTDSVLASLEIYFGHRWRNFGISLIYSAVNVGGALCLYWLFRVPKAPGRRRV